MNIKSLCETIDIPNHEFSVVLANPKPVFLAWVDEFVAKKGMSQFQWYAPEQNLVLLIPSVNRFSQAGDFDTFLDTLKPKLLEAELGRFGATPADVPFAVSAESFDRMFELSVRESSFLMSDFGFAWTFHSDEQQVPATTNEEKNEER